MKLLNELISIRRVNDDSEHQHDTTEEPNLDHIELDADEDSGSCPECQCDPCECDDDEYRTAMTDEFDTYGEIDPDEPVEDEAITGALLGGALGLALGAKGAYHAAKKTPLLGKDATVKNYVKNFVKGVADPRTYLPNKEEDEGASEAMDRGYEDCQVGKGREANPYPRGTQDHLDWDMAWQDANDAQGGNIDDGADYSDPIPDGSVADMEREHDMSDVEADADTLRNIGWGTDEDYGHYSDENEEQQDAYSQGSDDYNAGKGPEANRFERGTTDRKQWARGWEDARSAAQEDEESEYGIPGDEGGMKEECPACNGTGRDYDETCVRCGGKGHLVSGQYDEEDEQSDEDRDWEAYREQYSEARANGIDIGSFAEWKAKHDRINKLLKRRGEFVPPMKLHGSTEDEGENEWGDNAYGQQGAKMGGAKETDTSEFDINPDAADEVDLGDELGDNAEAGDEGDDQKLDALTDKASEDPDRAGVIRTVKNAHLVYKRQTEDGTYEELWIYNIGNMRDELDVRKAILAGTDIPTSKTASPDGEQQYELWSAGNAELLQIRGLPN